MNLKSDIFATASEDALKKKKRESSIEASKINSRSELNNLCGTSGFGI